jgi:hypothetical protein
MKFTKEQIGNAVAGINYWGSEILPEKRKAHYAEVMAENPELVNQMQIIGGQVAGSFITHRKAQPLPKNAVPFPLKTGTENISLEELAELVNRIALAEFLFISQLLHKEV